MTYSKRSRRTVILGLLLAACATSSVACGSKPKPAEPRVKVVPCMTAPDPARIPDPDNWPEPEVDGSTPLPLAETVKVLYLVQYINEQLAGCRAAGTP